MPWPIDLVPPTRAGRQHHVAIRNHLGVTPYGEMAERLLIGTVLDAAETQRLVDNFGEEITLTESHYVARPLLMAARFSAASDSGIQ
jgi:hypothetical protein